MPFQSLRVFSETQRKFSKDSGLSESQKNM